MKRSRLLQDLKPFFLGWLQQGAEVGLTVAEGPGVDLDGCTVGLGGDTILLCHGDGSPVAEYPATAEGLDSALAAAAAGDTVRVPSVTISGAHVVPTGIEVRGVGAENSVLSGAITNNGILSDLRVSGTLTNSATLHMVRGADGPQVTARLDVLGITEQMRLAYDADDYAGFSALEDGTLRISQTYNVGDPDRYPNLFIGSRAGNEECVTAHSVTDNVGIGNWALHALTSGVANTALGSSALLALTTGSYNIGLGRVGESLTTGAHNILASAYAGADTLVDGEHNIVLGSYAGSGALVSGDYNVIIGYQAQHELSSPYDPTNVVVIGKGAYAAQDNLAVIGGTDADAVDMILGGTSASAKLHIIKTSEQLRLAYDAGFYVQFVVDANGDLTITPSGGDVSIAGTFSATALDHALDDLSDVNAPSPADGEVLSWVAAAGEWQATTGGTTCPITTLGDLVVGDSGGSPARLAVGAYGQVLQAQMDGSVAWVVLDAILSTVGGCGVVALPDGNVMVPLADNAGANEFQVFDSVGTKIASIDSDGNASFYHLAVTSTALVSNLNADLLDGLHASAFAGASHNHVEVDITDLVHDAVKLQSRTLAATAPTDGQVLMWNDTAAQWEPSAASAGVTDHGALAGLGDDDHSQYLLANGNRELAGNWDAGDTYTITAMGFHAERDDLVKGPTLYFDRKHSAGTVSGSDYLGVLEFRGWTGAAYETGALVVGRTFEAAGTGDMPTVLEFIVAADGSTVSTSDRAMLELWGGENVVINFPDNAGGTALQLRDSDNALVAHIDSDGYIFAQGLLNGDDEGVKVSADGNISLLLGDQGGNRAVSIIDAQSSEVASIDSDGNAQFDGGLNLGMATGAAAGEIKASERILTDSYFRATVDGAEYSAYRAMVSGDTQDRFIMGGDGALKWGNGTDARDVNLYRNAANELKTDDSLTVAGTLTAGALARVGTAYESTGSIADADDWTSTQKVGQYSTWLLFIHMYNTPSVSQGCGAYLLGRRTGDASVTTLSAISGVTVTCNSGSSYGVRIDNDSGLTEYFYVSLMRIY